MKKIKGVGISPGISIGKAWIWENHFLKVPEYSIDRDNVEKEIARFHDALKETEEEIKELQKNLEKSGGKDYIDIFSFHIALLTDNSLIEKTQNIIKTERVNSESALKKVLQGVSREFQQTSSDFSKDRRRDLLDIIEKIIIKLKESSQAKIKKFKDEIIVAKDLAPSQTVSLDKNFINGFITETGSITSHTAILAKALEIPAVVANEKATEILKNGDLIIIDAYEGIIIQNPSDSLVKQYKDKKKELEKKKHRLSLLKDLKGLTKDGKKIRIQANIEMPEEIENALKYGAEGIGLYRTEYLYLNRKDLPGEDEQFLAYEKVCNKMAGSEIIIRTLDIGGDKFISDFPYPKELNPFLGWRGIRFCLERTDIFETQLKAILRAALKKKIKIMFPMVSTVEEIKQAKKILSEVQKSFKKENVAFNGNVEVGVMIEIPSAALISENMAKEVDFFSIGSNDLVQYTMAVDRSNVKISHLYQPCHPAVLKLIKTTVDNGKAAGIWTGICGEMASIPEIACLLVGMGAEELSMAPVAIPSVKEMLKENDSSLLAEIAEKVISFESHAKVYKYLKNHLRYPS